MPLALDRSQRQFYHTHGFIHLEGVLNSVKTKELKEKLIRSLEHRNQQFPQGSYKDFEWKMKRGRELFNLDPHLKYLVTKGRPAQLSLDLWNERPIRVAGDQLLISKESRSIFPFYSSLHKTGVKLSEFLSIKGLLGALIICLESWESEVDPEENELPRTAGSAFFVSDEFPWKLPALSRDEAKMYWLVAFGKGKCQYQPAPLDMNPDFIRTQGQGVGSLLGDERYPLIGSRL